jgi:hypothetical protein
MSDQQTIDELRRQTDTAVRDHHLDAGAGARAWSVAHGSPAGSRTRSRLAPAIAISVLATAGVAISLTAWGNRGGGGDPAGGGSACAGNVTTAPLPTWARAGFSPGGMRMPHVLGEHGRIVAIPFAGLRVHQPAGTNNKVLWVAKTGFGPLTIRATLEGTSQTATRLLPDGPGPSYVDLPAAGCWRMDLSWAGQHDSVALRYSP